jgi:hypothetical protein
MPGTTTPTTFTANERANSRPIHLYAFTRRDAIWRYTDAPEDVTVSSVTYRAAAISHDVLQKDEESAAAECTVTMDYATPIVAALDALGFQGPPIVCTIRQTHTTGIGGVASAAVAVRFKGALQSRTLATGQARFLVASLAAVLDKPLLTVLAQPTCNWTFGDDRCGIDVTLYTQTGCAVSAITGTEITVTDAASEADGYYTAGWATIETGSAAGERLFIQDHTGSALTLLYAPPAGFTTSDTVAITAGCDGVEATCIAKFSNVAYFGGFPRVPAVNTFKQAS